MLIYFDESYDQNNTYLLFGALFNPHPKFLHRKMLGIKRANNFRNSDGSWTEVKYNTCYSQERFLIYKEILNAFFDSTSWFRCLVVKQSELDLSFFGKPHEGESIKRARAYKKFAEMLISFNVKDTVQNVLLTDNMSRCEGDKFVECMKEIFCVPAFAESRGKYTTTLKEIKEVDSSLEQYQVIQVCDLLLGCVLNDLIPAKNSWKNEIRKYLKSNLEIDSFSSSFWRKFKKTDLEISYPKMNIWHWKPRKA